MEFGGEEWSTLLGYPYLVQSHYLPLLAAVHLSHGLFRRGFPLLKFTQNQPHDFLDLVHHVAVPEAQYVVALRFQEKGPIFIEFFLIQVLAPRPPR